MKATINGNILTLELEIKPQPSKSGKNLTIATTAGNHKCDVTYNGKPLTVGVNAYVAA